MLDELQSEGGGQRAEVRGRADLRPPTSDLRFGAHCFSTAPAHAPQAALVVAAGIGSVVRSLSASKTPSARLAPALANSCMALRRAVIRKSSAPSARSTRSRNAARSMSLL